MSADRKVFDLFASRVGDFTNSLTKESCITNTEQSGLFSISYERDDACHDCFILHNARYRLEVPFGYSWLKTQIQIARILTRSFVRASSWYERIRYFSNLDFVPAKHTSLHNCHDASKMLYLSPECARNLAYLHLKSQGRFLSNFGFKINNFNPLLSDLESQSSISLISFLPPIPFSFSGCVLEKEGYLVNQKVVFRFTGSQDRDYYLYDGIVRYFPWLSFIIDRVKQGIKIKYKGQVFHLHIGSDRKSFDLRIGKEYLVPDDPCLDLIFSKYKLLALS